MAEESGIVVHLKKEHERLMREIRGVSAALSAFGAAYGNSTGSRKLSAAAKARISRAQKARWSKVKGRSKQESSSVATAPQKRVISAASRRKMAAAQKARWAKVKIAGKKSA
jgi:hypothetical protein